MVPNVFVHGGRTGKLMGIHRLQNLKIVLFFSLYLLCPNIKFEFPQETRRRPQKSPSWNPLWATLNFKAITGRFSGIISGERERGRMVLLSNLETCYKRYRSWKQNHDSEWLSPTVIDWLTIKHDALFIFICLNGWLKRLLWKSLFNEVDYKTFRDLALAVAVSHNWARKRQGWRLKMIMDWFNFKPLG